MRGGEGIGRRSDTAWEGMRGWPYDRGAAETITRTTVAAQFERPRRRRASTHGARTPPSRAAVSMTCAGQRDTSVSSPYTGSPPAQFVPDATCAGVVSAAPAMTMWCAPCCSGAIRSISVRYSPTPARACLATVR